jgi:hypothetical protein
MKYPNWIYTKKGQWELRKRIILASIVVAWLKVVKFYYAVRVGFWLFVMDFINGIRGKKKG